MFVAVGDGAAGGDLIAAIRARRGEGRGAPPVDELAHAGAQIGDPDISPDGRTMVFSSDRPGGAGANDIYVAVRDCL